MRFSASAISSVASYTKMSLPVVPHSPATPATPPASSPATKEDELKKAAAATNGNNAKKFEGDGVIFKAKLIGMEDLTVDRDEKVCLDSMFKLKAVVRARGEHKQRVQLNLTMSAVKICDDTTKAQIASHEIERISFVVIDPRDTRAFGYIYNTSDERHQFWAIKTERAAAATVLALKELFELAFEQFTNGEKAQDEASKVIPPTVVPPPEVLTPQPAAPVLSLLDDAAWGDAPNPVIQTPPKTDPTISLWGTEAPVVPTPAPAPKPDDTLLGMLGDLSFSAPAPPATGLSFNTFPDPLPTLPAVPANPYGNFYAPATPPNPLNAAPTFVQQPQRPSTPLATPLLSPQPNLLNPAPISPVAPPTVTSPFADFDLLSGLSSGTTAKTTKDSFFPATAPKTMQQLQMEKQP